MRVRLVLVVDPSNQFQVVRSPHLTLLQVRREWVIPGCRTGKVDSPAFLYLVCLFFSG